jgi:hypothetical protein
MAKEQNGPNKTMASRVVAISVLGFTLITTCACQLQLRSSD